ncbi:sigma-70 family RNA polymerase sigma factor [Stappia indica]|uniref:RNA polymerase sigma factor n=1 Tax=Stappia indica TaxID=538381 RepID=A0A285SFN8_9HYPH|nr:sigma-70 family RNA polymerase sigma factor [Stappia indica]MCC4245100.1 sigma-70 family RNA polymerase sigma factor [Stappia indica]SOC06571.1 RNA polymerase sigma-70 factor, ECF subfamily [Stappia indica]
MSEHSLELKDEMVACIPSLRAFAASLVGMGDRADDLVQEALMKAWTNLGRFEPGTNMKAWLFTILRNTLYSTHRKRKREVQDVDGRYSATLAAHPNQTGHLDLDDFCRALDQLPDDQREALILIGASGFSYEEAAEICGCAIGTVKSRVNRARSRLADIMGTESTSEFGPDRAVEAVLALSPGSTVKISAME